ncbi:MAG TPA: NAD(P)/FAD-dependent oxidoreductase [Arenibacter sp.]|nr:NAD(P)/FAD-dependent oxidoreductase [Arenibacter sp.]
MESKRRRHIVVVGGGFGGIAVANALKKVDAEVTIIDRLNHHLFQPLLYQVATAALSPGDIAAPIREILGKNSKINVLMGEVQEIRPKENSLVLKDGRSINFDELVLATGAQYNYFGHDEWAEYAPGLKSIGDALIVREKILLSMEEAEQVQDIELRKPLLTYVVIGGGPTGVEMAGAIGEIARSSFLNGYRNIRAEDIDIYLIEAGPRILNAFPESLGADAKNMLGKLGVKVLLNTPVTKIEREKVYIASEAIETSNIIWAAGIKAPTLLDTMNVQQDRSGRVLVSPDLSIPKYPNIFVIGDSAHLGDEKGNPLPALAPVATQQGRYIGKLLANPTLRTSDYPGFKYFDKGTMATVGRAKAVADIKGVTFSGVFAWLLWSFIHILSLIGFRSRIRVFIEWIWNFLTFKRGVRLITDRSGCEHCEISVKSRAKPLEYHA